MAQQRRRARINVPICLAGVLLCLTMFSVYLASGVFARYTTTAVSGDSARVITFGDIDLTQYGSVPQYIAPGVTLKWNAKVFFKGSESATFVFLEVMPTGSCTVSDDGMTYSFPPAVIGGWMVHNEWTFLKKESSGTYVYYLALEPNEDMPSGRVFFENTDTVVSEEVTADQLESMTDIKASFRASVVQSNGFDSVDDAWTSLKTKHG